MNQDFKNKRRALLKAMALASSTSLLGLGSLHAAAATANTKLDILFLGGTGFIGPHMVRQCLEQGHSVTLFNRGKRNSSLFPELETIVGDRDPEVGDGLDGLKGRKWDVVIDTSGYIPRHVAASAELLKDVVSQYLFISSVSVYSDFSIKGMTEDAPLIVLDDPSVEQITGDTYGGLKVLCENAVVEHFGETATILRPTYIVGPGDHTDRFIHYIHRPLSGGRMAMPGKPSNPVSYIDVRDLAAFVERSVANKITGIYNMVEQPNAATFGELIDLSVALAKSDTEVVWLDSEFLEKQRELIGEGYAMFPMWHDQDNSEFSGFSSQVKAAKAGLVTRPFKETVTSTYDWWIDESQERRDKRRVHISDEFEASLLAAWDRDNEK
jgi:2'-hydroxyisoflavone reductase